MSTKVKGKEKRSKKNGTNVVGKHNNFRYEFGSVDVETDKACFLSFSVWVMPDDNDLDPEMDVFKRRLKVFLNQISPIYFEGLEWSVLRNVDYAQTNTRITKQSFSFVSIEFTYMFGDKINIKSPEFKFILKKMSHTIIEWLEAYSDGLCFSPVNVK